MKRSGSPKRKTPLKAGKPIARGKPPKRRAKPIARAAPKPRAAQRTPQKRKPPRSGDVPRATRAFVMARAGWRCEVRVDPDCRDYGLAPHHRLSRKHGDHSAANLVVACQACHTDGSRAIHRNRGWSVRVGLIIPSSRAKDPIVPWDPSRLEETSR